MKVELQAATAINEYHPEVAKLNYINKKLSAELSSLKNSATIIETTEKNKTLQTKLESTFTELQQEQPDSGKTLFINSQFLSSDQNLQM